MLSVDSLELRFGLCQITQRCAGAAQRLFKAALVTTILILVGFTPATLNAQNYANSQPLVIRNDRGGLLNARLHQIRNLRATGQPVMITGRVCLSTCTMLLGLPQTCVSPKTTFGFHGPSSYGRKLNPERFEWASQVIAQYYPPALKAWYLNEARHTIYGIHRISGSQIIAMGIKQC